MKKVFRSMLSCTLRKIENTPLFHFVFTFLAVIILWACTYYVLTPISNGIGSNGVSFSEISFLDSLYFSIVTISSLGYGDMHPMGICKLIAGIEVVVGLLLMGLMLAKLTSSRLTYHVSRIYSSEIRKRLKGFTNNFKRFERSIKIASNHLSDAFTPIQGKSILSKQPEAINTFSEIIIDMQQCYFDFYEYINQENEKGDFFVNAPKSFLIGSADSLDQNIFLLSQLIVSLPSYARVDVLNLENRRKVSGIMERLIKLCDIVIDRSKDSEINESFLQVKKRCTEIPENIYSVPAVVADEHQPDQRLDEDDQPK